MTHTKYTHKTKYSYHPSGKALETIPTETSKLPNLNFFLTWNKNTLEPIQIPITVVEFDGEKIKVSAVYLRLTNSIVGNTLQVEEPKNNLCGKMSQQKEYTRDFLTGAALRENIESIFQSHVDSVKSINGSFIVSYVDINNFKEINDRYGHSVGDAILIDLAKRINKKIKGDVVRVGGDEFVIFTPKVESITCPFTDIAEETVSISNLKMDISLSIGQAIFPKHAHQLDELLHYADAAMYEAKKKRSGAKLFSKEIKERKKRRQAIIEAIPKAIETGNIKPYFQPIVSLRDRSLTGVEVLARWDHEDLGSIAPDEFIRIAEDSGSIVDLDHYMINRSLQNLSKWISYGYVFDGRISINASATSLCKADFSKRFLQAIELCQIPPRYIAIELTENASAKDETRIRNTIKELSSIGIHFYLDDFGTGYSSMRMMQIFDFKKLKIDKCFVSNIQDSAISARIIQGISLLANSLSLKIVAEGIETGHQERFLRSFLCHEGQGYLFSKPLEAEDFAATWLIKQGRR